MSFLMGVPYGRIRDFKAMHHLRCHNSTTEKETSEMAELSTTRKSEESRDFPHSSRNRTSNWWNETMSDSRAKIP